MIKVYRGKTIVIVFLVITLITSFVLIYKNIRNRYKTVQVLKNSNNIYKILVDVEDSKLFLFENNEVVKVYKCSGGKASTPSPIGTWNITSKAKWGEGFGRELASGLMFLGVNFGIHGTLNTYSIGWASSHGCIRMNNKDVAELYKIISIGTKVTIIDGVYGSFGKGLRIIKSGMYGADILQIQKKLKELGFFNRKPKWKIRGRNRKSSRKIL